MPKEQRRMKFANNGVIIQSPNRRTEMIVREDGIKINFLFADKERDVNIPACGHSVMRNKVRVTEIKISQEALDELAFAWTKYREIGGKKNPVNLTTDK